MPDFKTIADFRKDNGEAIRRVSVSLWCCAGALNSSPRRSSRLTAVSSKPSTRVTGTSPKPRCSGGWSRLMLILDGFLNVHRAEIVLLASRYRLPTVYPWRFFPELGGLVSYAN